MMTDREEDARGLFGIRSEPAQIDPDVLAEKLRDALVLWQSPHIFKVGDILQHRPGILSIDSTALRLIVVAVYPNAPINAEPSNAPPGGCADLLLGYYDGDDDFTLGFADSRKYEPAP